MATVALLGAGKIGGALLGGLLAAGTPPDTLRIVENGPHAKEISERLGVDVVDPADAAAAADVLVIAVKPADVAAVLREISPVVDPARHLVVSVAAGMTTAYLQARLPEGVPVVRAMPNTPLLVGEGMTCISPGKHTDDAHLDVAAGVFANVGRVLRVPEHQLDAVTALSGSGPAYLFLVAEALADAGVLLGLSKAVALELIAQTAVGAAALLRDSGDTPAALRDAVSSPGGTTIAAVQVLEERGVRAAFMAAAEAAQRRSRQMALEQG